MELIRELHPYVGATWREISQMLDEAGEDSRGELLGALQVQLGRSDLQETGLVELVWLAVGSHRAPAPYDLSEISRREIEVLEKLQVEHDRVLKLLIRLERGDEVNS